MPLGALRNMTNPSEKIGMTMTNVEFCRFPSFKALSCHSRSFAYSFLLALGFACLNTMPAAARDLTAVKPVIDCGALAKMVLSGPDFEGRVDSAALVVPMPPSRSNAAGRATMPTTQHPFCDVKGYVAPQVRFEVHLPTESWTQRLLFTGCGGFCGTVRLSGGVTQGDNCKPVTNDELAMVSSDLGHSSQGMDAVWAANKDLRDDFGYRGVHVTTEAAKQVVARFYGQPQAFAYFDGCSDGGREAMVSVERYPADFNGVIAGAPVFNEVANNTIYHAWGVQKLINPDGSMALSDAALATLHNAALAACGTFVGDTKQDLVVDPPKCRFDPSVVACKEGEAANDCLTPEQIKVAHELYIGPHDPAGDLLYFGYDPGSELGWNRQAEGDSKWGPGSFPGYLASDPPDPKAEFKSLAFTREAVKKNDVFADVLDAQNADLRPLQKAGAKLIIWQGWADVAVAPMRTVDFYRSVREKLGPEADSFIRLYMLPGVAHCGGGDGPDRADLMAAIIAWTEDGVAPGPMTVVKKDLTGAITAKEIIQPYH
jgi:feruloyl esterase